jgi:hypothetical protein
MKVTGDNLMTNIILGSTIALCWGLGVVMPTLSFMQPGAFEPEAIAAMSEAFDAACESQRDVVREVIARRIIAAARFGERDPVRLLEAALRKSD